MFLNKSSLIPMYMHGLHVLSVVFVLIESCYEQCVLLDGGCIMYIVEIVVV